MPRLLAKHNGRADWHLIWAEAFDNSVNRLYLQSIKDGGFDRRILPAFNRQGHFLKLNSFHEPKADSAPEAG